MNDITVSVIIPAYNESANIGKCLESVVANVRSDFEVEIIVVDNGSTDGTLEIVRGFPVKVIENREGQRKNIGVLRNLGAGGSRGSILAFLDADMVVPPNWLKKAKEYFDGGFTGALGFMEDIPVSAGWVGKTWGWRFSRQGDRAMEVDFLPGRNLFVNRHVFGKINGFDEDLITGEDKDLTLRVLQAGFRVISVPDISVIHLGYEKNLPEFLKKEFWRQGNTLRLAKKRHYSFRALRNPLLSSWHILMPSAIILSAVSLHALVTFFLVFLWLLPSVLITLSKVALKRGMIFFVHYYLLTFIRWHVAGLALVWQLIKGISFREVRIT